jgi:hypothetical protein
MTSEFRVPAPLQNTIDNLAFLASTDDGEKLFFKERLHINKTDWTARMRRYYYNETLESQKKIIKEIIDLGLDSLKSYKENVHYNRLVTEFAKAKDGLSNLRNTYLKEGREIQDLDNYIYVMENQMNALKIQSNNGNETFQYKTFNIASSNDNSENIITEQPKPSAVVPMNTSQHYHFNENVNHEDQSDNVNQIIEENENQTNSQEKNHYVIDMNSLNMVVPQTESSMNTNGLQNKTKTRAKTIPIKNRPELEEYMKRSKQQ